MTKRHFEKLAKIIKEAKELIDEQGNSECDFALDVMTNKITEFCKEMNPRFDKKRFLKACGF